MKVKEILEKAYLFRDNWKYKDGIYLVKLPFDGIETNYRYYTKEMLETLRGCDPEVTLDAMDRIFVKGKFYDLDAKGNWSQTTVVTTKLYWTNEQLKEL